jgi:hypothetical protein
MIEIEVDPVDLVERSVASFPVDLDSGVGSSKYVRVREGSHCWVVKVGTGAPGEPWLHGAFDVGLTGVVLICGAGHANLVSTANPANSVLLPTFPVLALTKGSRELPCVLNTFNDLVAIRSDASWWIVKGVSADGFRGIVIRRDTVCFEVWVPERSEWESHKLSVVNGHGPADEGR